MEAKVEVSIKGWPEIPPTSPRLLNLWAEAASDYWGVSIEDLKSKSRSLRLVWPRSVCMWLGRNAGYSSPAVADFWDKDHSTVLHAVKLVGTLREHKPTYETQFRQFGVFAKKYIQRHGGY
tara:strand:+ start:596 stop:958 length:363 start_codon:yes stop_codon:yes gene_type:complete